MSIELCIMILWELDQMPPQKSMGVRVLLLMLLLVEVMDIYYPSCMVAQPVPVFTDRL